MKTRGDRRSRSRNFLTPRGGRRLLSESRREEEKREEKCGDGSRSERLREEARLYLPPRYAIPSSIITVLKPATSASESTRCIQIASGAFLRTVMADVA